jgi:Fe-S cluster assembly scaffold protein SufB
MQAVLLKEQTEFILEPKVDTLYLVLLDKNANQGKIKVDLSFQKTGVSCQLLFLGRLKNNSSWQLESNIKHFASKTSCLTDVYLSQADASRVDYFGQIYIDRLASQTKSFLKEQSLILGKATYNRSRPILEIFNNQVKASHSASSSRLDETDLFYLMSRGFKKAEAEKILEEAFFNKVLDSIKIKSARKLIKDYLC